MMQNLLQHLPMCGPEIYQWARPTQNSDMQLVVERLCIESKQDAGKHLRAPLLQALANTAVTGDSSSPAYAAELLELLNVRCSLSPNLADGAEREAGDLLSGLAELLLGQHLLRMLEAAMPELRIHREVTLQFVQVAAGRIIKQ